MNQDIENLRRIYDSKGISRKSMMANPIDQFDYWLDEARETDILDPTAATLATVSPDGTPSARIILVKEVDETGFIFYTNYDSEKSKNLDNHPIACLNFYWDQLHRQVRLTGTIEKVSKEKSEAYFHSRPFDSQVMATISNQSQDIHNRLTLEDKFEEALATYEGKEVPLPENWGGFKLTPTQAEFWQGRPSRLHDRILYTLENGTWTLTRLQP